MYNCKNAELRQALEGHETRITKLEQGEKEKSISTPEPLIISRFPASLIYKPKSLEDKAVDDFVNSKYKESIKLFIPKLSPQEEAKLGVEDSSIIIQNHMTEISETSSPRKSNIDKALQHLVQLCDKAFDAKDGTNRANQEEILYWSIYGKDFRTSGPRKILPKVTKLTAISILSSSISNHSVTTSDNFSGPEKVLLETKINASSAFQPKKDLAHVIKIVLEQFPYLTLKYSNEYGDYFNCPKTCLVCNKEHKRDDVKGGWGSDDYANTVLHVGGINIRIQSK
ncbi:17710_t:CDS:2 [Gigaspora margarita]|uniref:17710_t:CDS:1 n=1 Tax=Gigaspora margarita TaxID=4874 RepID=A0ABN7V854_GIGMA|nr:17710_t:CDS:2 [Gigaspora margarita]